MSDDRSIIYLRVAPERIADVNWILALVTTEDPREGVVKLLGTPDTYNDVMEIIENMPFTVEILEGEPVL